VLGKPGWFWMFVLEGLPAVALGVFAFFYLDDNPRQARFLTEEERTALVTQLADEQQQTETSSVKAAMRSGTVWHLALIYGTLQIGVYGLMFFLPSQVASLMGTHLGFKASLVAAIPWAFSALGVYFLPRYADRKTARRLPIAVGCMVAAALGLVVSSYAGPLLAIVALSCCAVSFLAVQPIFWTFPAQVLTGPALAAGIGFCTTLGAAFSFLAPLIRTEAEQRFHSPHAGPLVLAAFSLLCATLLWALRNRRADVSKQDAEIAG
jgi:sugar phosphate permease